MDFIVNIAQSTWLGIRCISFATITCHI